MKIGKTMFKKLPKKCKKNCLEPIFKEFLRGQAKSISEQKN
jgi:hypothetical protein